MTHRSDQSSDFKRGPAGLGWVAGRVIGRAAFAATIAATPFCLPASLARANRFAELDGLFGVGLLLGAVAGSISIADGLLGLFPRIATWRNQAWAGMLVIWIAFCLPFGILNCLAMEVPDFWCGLENIVRLALLGCVTTAFALFASRRRLPTFVYLTYGGMGLFYCVAIAISLIFD